MGIDEIYDNADNIQITEFMAAIGQKPVREEGHILTYNAPYNLEELCLYDGIRTIGKPTCFVDTKRNVWRDKNYTPWQPIIALVGEIQWECKPEKLKAILASIIFNHRKKEVCKELAVPTAIKEMKKEPVKSKRKMRL